ncbi:CgeB family protein [Paucidesulfovibrio longus]|uniref:CgeB family protein n=1 Tax=Paucidesulfovibrio longus TaxID=889 RepID=UPI0003B59778|nr:glycosyltransferase [Paucidesulfovibrio longus]
MNKPLRILVVLPMYGGSLPVGQFCAQALRQEGHLVEVFNAPEFYPAYRSFENLRVTTDRLDYLQNSYVQIVSQGVLAKVETFEPDMVLALAQAPLTRQVLKRLRNDHVVTAMWFVEDFRLFTYWKTFAPLYDVFAVIQKDQIFDELKAIGQENVLYLPLAAQPDFHRPLELSSVERRKWGSDVSFMGAGYPNRRLAFRELLGFDFKIWGSDWDGDHVLAPYLQMGGARVSSEECVRIFNATKINLNLHSSVHVEQLVSRGDFVNPRTFEVAGCGAFQLVDERSLLPESFRDDEMATFTSLEDLKEKIAYYLSRPEEREATAQRGRERVLAEHTYAHRMASLVEFTARQIPGWPSPRAGSKAASDLPPELAAEIDALIQRLGLPGDVGFDDLIWALRQQKGRLSGLETALLFLDEWKKLYASKT